jgi:selenocysteine-specific elongation factor
MPIIGTAGHVDHGKSTLVQALTGRDPDRWTAEKERGLTIDLGFAWADLGTGEVVGFVDVPGHERFVKNMLAGVGGFDVALLVVAADEGWMPQSEEHLTVLDLLQVRHGTIALSRVDLADPDLIDLARADVATHVAGTVAERWPVVEVSPITGSGMGELRASLAASLGAAGPPPDRDRPRLWIDRSFVIAGSGVVVTGTLTGGTIGIEDRLEIVPGGPVRVRSLQSYEETVVLARPGTRVAANITGVQRATVERGALLTRPGTTVATDRMLVTLARPPRPLSEPSDRASYHLHLGTATVPARLRLVEDGFAVATLERRLPVTSGDRFILRDTGRRVIAAGGVVLDPVPDRRTGGEDAGRIRDGLDEGPDALATALVAVHRSIDAPLVEIATGGGSPVGVVRAGDRYFSPDTAEGQIGIAARIVDEFHRDHPLRPGMPASSLASRLGMDRSQLSALIDAGGGELVDEGATIRRGAFQPRLADDDEVAWREARRALGVSLAVPRASQLGLEDDVLHAVVRRGDLVLVADDLVYLPEQVADVDARLRDFTEPFTVSEFREALGLSRRQAVPLLEWLDRNGRTVRNGDRRTVKR